MRQSDPTKESGIYGKYHGLRRTRDDSEVEGWYFVLRPYSPERGGYDRAALAALEAYADACEGYAPELATDLRTKAKGFREGRAGQLRYLAKWER